MSAKREGRVPVPAAMLRDPGHLLALGFGSGLSPRAPGTVGSLLAVIMALPMLSPGAATEEFALAVMLATAFAAIPLCGRTAKALGVHDHGAIVLDEFAGVWLALAMVMVSGPMAVWMPWCVFFWFRVFDIVKPGPVGWLDRRLTGGLGIVADDLAAGVFAGLVSAGMRAASNAAFGA